MELINLCLRNEAAVSDEVRRKQRHSTLPRKLHEARIDVLVREPLHQLVMADGVRRDMDRLSDARGGHAGLFNAGNGFHCP
jgi:hypothetical protein